MIRRKNRFYFHIRSSFMIRHKKNIKIFLLVYEWSFEFIWIIIGKVRTQYCRRTLNYISLKSYVLRACTVRLVTESITWSWVNVGDGRATRTKKKKWGTKIESRALSLFTFRKPKAESVEFFLGFRETSSSRPTWSDVNVPIVGQCQATASFWLLTPRDFGESEKWHSRTGPLASNRANVKSPGLLVSIA